MNKKFGSSRGQIMVVYTCALVTLLGAIALCTDVAVMYVNWQAVRKAADAGAVAGAIQFAAAIPSFNIQAFTGPAAGCSGGSVEQQAACTYAVHNTAAVSEVTVTVPAPNVPASVPAAYASQTVQVTVNRTNIPVLFGGVLGVTNPYGATVTAIAVGPLPLNGVLNPFPAGIPAQPNGQPITFGTQFTLTNADPSSANQNYGPGNWGWLSVDGNGASNLASNITSGCSCQLTVGQSIKPATGEQWGQVQPAVNGLITSPGLAPANLTGTESQLVSVPIVTPFTNGSSAVTILGFAEVWLVSDIQKNSNSQVLTVEFVKYVPNDGLGGGGPNDFGAYSKPALVL